MRRFCVVESRRFEDGGTHLRIEPVYRFDLIRSYSDSLPGFWFVIDGTESSGCGFNAANKTVNDATRAQQ